MTTGLCWSNHEGHEDHEDGRWGDRVQPLADVLAVLARMAVFRGSRGYLFGTVGGFDCRRDGSAALAGFVRNGARQQSAVVVGDR